MKKILCSFAFIILFTSTSFAANFVEIIRDENFLIFVDTESIQYKNSHYVAWSKWILRGENAKEAKKRYKKPVSHIMMLDAYKKESREVQLLASYTYATDGSILNSASREISVNKWDAVIPQSYGDVIYQAVIRIAEGF